MSEKPREQTAIMHFRRKSSDRMSEKSREQISVREANDGEDGIFVGRVPTGCLRGEKKKQQSESEDDTFVGRVPTGCQRSRENRLQLCFVSSV